MKARKAFLLLLAALTLAACKYDDSALWEQVNQNTEELAAQAARIAALEAWQAETNTNIEALQTLLSTTDYITAVTPVVKDGVEVGFTISFLNTPAITIYHGTKGEKGDTGDTPQIGAAQGEDGNWYWTLNGEFLTSITLPASLTSIGYRAFRYCESLKTVTCLAATPPGLGTEAFENYALTAIQVPAASVDDYKAAQYWNYYADKIVAIEP